jgi:hypothetical protein
MKNARNEHQKIRISERIRERFCKAIQVSMPRQILQAGRLGILDKQKERDFKLIYFITMLSY